MTLKLWARKMRSMSTPNEIQPQIVLSTKWIENLALDEINMEESGVINFSEHLDPSYLLEESSIEVMNTLRDRFETYVGKFNEYRGDSGVIRVFKISNTVNDFMFFRNSLRLVVARKAIDLISIGFLGSTQDIYSARTTSSELQGSSKIHEIKAHVGPFNDITWRFDGEPVNIDSLVRHYLSEFIKNSAR